MMKTSYDSLNNLILRKKKQSVYLSIILEIFIINEEFHIPSNFPTSPYKKI